MDQVDQPTIVVRGEVPEGMIAYGREKLLAVGAHAPRRVLAAELRLDHHPDPARPRPNHVEMTLDLNGVAVRAQRSAETMSEAIDRAAARLRRRIETAGERPRARSRRSRDQHSWHHEDLPTERPNFYPRPVAERRLVRQKTFAMQPESIEEALFDLERLDHVFFLFVHDDTGAEAVVYRVGDGYGLRQRVATPEAVKRVEIPLDLGPNPATVTIDDALAVLNASDAPFEFFVDESSGRGMVAYRRYDGHYGLSLPA